MRNRLFVLTVLAATQLFGWGSVNILPVLAARIAADLSVSLPTVFLGSSVMFVSMGLAAPVAGRAFRRFGAQRVMAAGAALLGCGILAVAAAQTVTVFLIAWGLTGAAGALFLTTSAFAYIAEFTPDRARGMIGSLMLVTGLAGSVFWPVTGFLDHLAGWRGALMLYGAGLLLIVAPLSLVALPATAPRGRAAEAPARRRGTGAVFWLIVLAITLNSFVTFGVEAVGIELFRAMGADLAQAVAIASLLGVIKVGGRLIDLAGGRRWDGLSTALVAGAMIPAGVAVLAFGGIGPVPLVAWLALYGLGSGAFAVARATMPLVFYEKADYAAAMSAIALPMNLINALAPPGLAALMSAAGPRPVFGLLGGLSAAALLVLWRLNALRGLTAAR
ncbi:MFS transporter [Frigidibacter oleivorans]|uniref:MFS transporter n=1 Tax=Frigidibacter oleivorans TaxID=2487129 RepID=UPI000F8D9D01|nr:MFS transporter [Frigidibacter oleivorans]